ncbi:hypothetical protein SeMB42_g07578 [Synchytrium endobioticum]|uniref:Uncharacterized protein n=1 Tax=Synchytrium endobioticum TaxID=286115 RepID=A0A507C072_9FUNG|nr:hypothetical protein SeMB42_g07578 [Synchytrium endobioticum]TPX39202.1 hypothetical protein SeLEV6574_g07381 [Synchytrium endobioticum]
MAVPYSDIGKSASDLLSKDFPIGSAKLEISSLASNGAKFTVLGSKDNKTNAIAGEFKSKYTVKPQGLTLTEAWTTGNVLSVDVESADFFAKGLKLNLATAVLPASGQRNAKFNAEYRQSHFYSRTFCDLTRPTITEDVVVAHDGILAGGEFSYDIAGRKISRYNAALGYIGPDYAVSLHASNAFGSFTAAYFHKVRSDLEVGAKATWNRGTDSTVAIEAGSKWVLDRESFIKAKVDSTGRLGLGYSQLLRPGVKLGLGASFDTAGVKADAHKMGVSLTFDF